MPALMDSVNDLAYALQEREPAAGGPGADLCPVLHQRLWQGGAAFLHRPGQLCPVAQAAKAATASVAQAADRRAGRAGPGGHRREARRPKSRARPASRSTSPTRSSIGSPLTGPQSYTAIARRFADESLWDDFLAFHYTGRPFERDGQRPSPCPSRGPACAAPGAGADRRSRPSACRTTWPRRAARCCSAPTSAARTSATSTSLSAFTTRRPTRSSSPTRDYLESADTREIDGVYYPDWGEGRVHDGVRVGAGRLCHRRWRRTRWWRCSRPQSYGATFEEAVYTVDGIYTYADGGESRYARLYFSDGVLRQVFGFTGEGGTGAPREIIPQTGDRFTVLEKWLDLDAAGHGSPQTATQEGGTLTFGDQMFAWEDLDAAPGDVHRRLCRRGPGRQRLRGLPADHGRVNAKSC